MKCKYSTIHYCKYLLVDEVHRDMRTARLNFQIGTHRTCSNFLKCHFRFPMLLPSLPTPWARKPPLWGKSAGIEMCTERPGSYTSPCLQARQRHVHKNVNSSAKRQTKYSIRYTSLPWWGGGGGGTAWKTLANLLKPIKERCKTVTINNHVMNNIAIGLITVWF